MSLELLHFAPEKAIRAWREEEQRVNVPLVDLKAQYASIASDIRAAIDRVCASQHFILGPEVSRLEAEVAAFCGARFGVGVSSGTDALLAGLMALGVGAGDEVVTTPFSFFATAGVIARLGARPVFVDIDPQTFNIDLSAIPAKLGAGTKAIIPVHLYGRCIDLTEVVRLGATHGVPIIEDAAQAIGATDPHGRFAGTGGIMGCFSFFPSKNLGAFGDGGMVVTNNQGLAEQLRSLRVHGATRKDHYAVVGGNFRLDALQAAVLRVKLPHVAAWTAKRRANADRYRRLCQAAGLLDWLSLPQDAPGHVYHQFTIRLPGRDRMAELLRQRGVATGVYYPRPLHLQEYFAPLGYRQGDFPQAEAAAREALALPIYPELSEAQQRYVVDALKAARRESGG